jgi:hypothetical protein
MDIAWRSDEVRIQFAGAVQDPRMGRIGSRPGDPVVLRTDSVGLRVCQVMACHKRRQEVFGGGRCWRRETFR